MGFTGGNNLVFRKLLKNSRADLYFLLNIDTEIEPNCILELVNTLREDASIGMVEALQKPKEHPKYYDPDSFETGWCSGGGVMIAKEALMEVGLFDERLFLYCEDVDLSWRMWLKGWRCVVNPKALYNHFTEDQDAGKDLSLQHYYSMRNCFFMHYKYDSTQGIAAMERLFHDTLSQQQDEKFSSILLKAYNDALNSRPRFVFDRLARIFHPRCKWIMFNGFSFEIRRDFVDSPDGMRIITPLPSGLVKEI